MEKCICGSKLHRPEALRLRSIGAQEEHRSMTERTEATMQEEWEKQQGKSRPNPILFKVWVQIERIDEDKDESVDEGLPDSLDCFSTLEDAQAFVRSLPGWAMTGGSSDHRQRD